MILWRRNGIQRPKKWPKRRKTGTRKIRVTQIIAETLGVTYKETTTHSTELGFWWCISSCFRVLWHDVVELWREFFLWVDVVDDANVLWHFDAMWSWFPGPFFVSFRGKKKADRRSHSEFAENDSCTHLRTVDKTFDECSYDVFPVWPSCLLITFSTQRVFWLP